MRIKAVSQYGPNDWAFDVNIEFSNQDVQRLEANPRFGDEIKRLFGSLVTGNPGALTQLLNLQRLLDLSVGFDRSEGQRRSDQSGSSHDVSEHYLKCENLVKDWVEWHRIPSVGNLLEEAVLFNKLTERAEALFPKQEGGAK